MKYLILTILCLGTSVKTFGQFNTILSNPSHYKVQAETNDSCNVMDVNETVSTKGKTVRMDVDSIRQELIRRYLSVSYPLSHIQVTSSYGMRRHPIFRRRMMHQGIDLRAKYEEVYSVMDGEVIEVSSDRRSGRYVTVRYPGHYTCSYCHLSQPLVKKGTFVKAGEVLAISGNTGQSTAAHLHFGVRNASGKRLNPMVLLDFIRNTREEVVRRLRELHEMESGNS